MLEGNANHPRLRQDDTSGQDVVTQEILPAIEGLLYGEVTVTVREGRVVQIERIARSRQFQSKRAAE